MSETSSRTRSDSPDDPEYPEQERKRQKLNSSKPDAEAAAMVHPTPPSESSSASESRAATPPSAATSNSAGMHVATSPTSKVTINTRVFHTSQTSQPEANKKSCVTAAPPEASMKSRSQSFNDANGTTAPAISGDGSSDEAKPISISSSPSKSPEIEIAEVEDFDQEPSQTRWTTVSRVSRKLATQVNYPYYVNRTFPYARDNCAVGSSWSVVPELAACFLNGNDQDGEVFHMLKSWLSVLLSDFDRLEKEFLLYEVRFWRELPECVSSLLKREIDAPAQARPQDLENCFVDYGRLVVLLIQVDLRQLRSYSTSTEPREIADLFCRNYLSTLTWILQYREIPFYTTLKKSRNYNPANLVSAIVDRLADPETVNILHFLSELLYELAGVLTKKPALAQVFLQILTTASQFSRSVPERVNLAADAIYLNSPYLGEIRYGSVQFFLKADEILQKAIVKQVPWLTIENSPDLLRVMAKSMQCLADQIPSFRSEIIASAGVNPSEYEAEGIQDVVCYAWKFKTLRKYATHGRMELRVHGIDAMQNELVHVFACYIRGKSDFMTVPLVRFLVHFIQQTKLIDYIIGVDSHPQLIGRSSNIVGFLCVTGTYSDADTDTIWQTVTDSQDPRTISGVLELLRADFSMLNGRALHYMGSKLLEMPLRRFDPRLLDFMADLLDNIRSKPQAENGLSEPHHAIITTLCVRLLREASAMQDSDADQLQQIRHVAIEQLKNTIRPTWVNGPLRVDKHEQDTQWRLLTQDLAMNNDLATGSVQAMNCWLTAMPIEDVIQLTAEFDVAHLLVENIAHLSDHLLASAVQDTASVDLAFVVRLDALFFVIRRVPQAINDAMIESLWSKLFTASHLSEWTRCRAWTTLSSAMQDARADPNPVIEQVLRVYLPQLQSQELSTAVFDFIKCSIEYETRLLESSLLDKDEVITIPGIERAWRVMLEAPAGTVEADAIDFIIRQYLDNTFIIKHDKSCIEATHLSLIDRCVRQVISSASRLKSFTEGTMSGEDEPMIIIASDDEIRAEELRFSRSLLFLRKFLEGMKARPRYSPPPIRNAKRTQQSFDKRGEIFEVKLQVYGSPRLKDEGRHLSLGYSNTGSELWQYLSEITGFTHFSVINAGQRPVLKDSQSTLKELRFTPGSLLLNKTANTPENVPVSALRATSPVDDKVMDHFQELYELLEQDENLAREVYNFLSLFPAQSALLGLVRSRQASPDELLPADKPYRLLYAAQALRSCMEDESYSSAPDTELISYGITTIIATFSRVPSSHRDEELERQTAQRLLDSLLLGFRAQVPPTVSQTYITEHSTFVDYLLRMMHNGHNYFRASTQQKLPSSLVRDPFEALIEGALHDKSVWSSLKSNPSTTAILEQVILVNSRPEVRKAIVEVISGLAGSSGAKLVLKMKDPRAARSRFSTATIDETLENFWALLSKILPDAVSWPFQCQELFEAGLVILRRIGKSIRLNDLTELFQQWSSILVGYHHKEIVGVKLDDHVVWGFTKLLHECCKLARAADATLPVTDLATTLISHFLFPELAPYRTGEEQTRMPVLSSATREDLYDLVLLLIPTQDATDAVVALIEDTVPKDTFFEANQSHDRQSLRSEVGYAGIRNLSNTCYLNSLFSQLFMNVQFRDFVLRTEVVDELRQKLISQLAKVFAHMQNSYERYIDPSSAVESIAIPSFTGQDEQIDVAVQMDVDEFYNILFDQIERQVLDPGARKQFKSLYGGQLVQQVKSKECEHISERLEPFSNVQIEIKGKAGLQEGLRAYVEGEVLQGDNKYSCTSCERHVDAVKRACLKDVPDSLIFNLKRFDYDIMTGTRCKINDHFEFPETIDITPYTVDYLSNPESPTSEDMFELTGIIVHSGTADSGHYYSFIRQRPSSKPKTDSWVQFNDTEVISFDPAKIAENCFGGVDIASAFQWPKMYSAYMLFYQRSTSIEKLGLSYTQHDLINPVRLPLPGQMEEYLRQQNELVIRSYCAQDPSHANFMRQLLERVQISPDQHCSQGHVAESRLLCVAFEYVQQVSCRWKELPEVESTIKILRQNAIRCPDCAVTILKLFTQENVIGEAVLQSPYPTVRKQFTGLLYNALVKLNKTCNEESLTEQKAAERDALCRQYDAILGQLASRFAEVWNILQRYGRAWGDYFEALALVVRLGYREAEALLESRFLELTLEIVWVHVPNAGSTTKRLKNKYQQFLTLREKGRPYHLGFLIDFLAGMLSWLDLRDQSDDDDRARSGQKFGITAEETGLLGFKAPPQRGSAEFEWLRRIIIGRHNPPAVNQMVRHLTVNQGMARYVYKVLDVGLGDELITHAVTFLEPTLIFCAHCTLPAFVNRLVKNALQGIESIGFQFGKEHIEFVNAMLSLENEKLGYEQGHFEADILSSIGSWAPVLLIYPNNDVHHDVARETSDTLRYLLFRPAQSSTSDAQTQVQLRRAIRKLATIGAQYAAKFFINGPIKERCTLGPGQAAHFLEVVEFCLKFFDEGNALDEQKIAEITEVLEVIRARNEAAVERLSNEWEAGEEADSDVAEMTSEFEDGEGAGSP